MSRVQQLAAAARSPTAKLHELRLKYWNTDVDTICCFEGGDDISFYLPFVRSHLGVDRNRLAFVNCGGKGVVITLWRNAIELGWNLSRVGFFVDRDLDHFISGNPAGDQIYVTDYYSIESSVADGAFFDSIWEQVFRLPLDDQRYASWRGAYLDGFEALASRMFPFFYFAVACKRAGGGVDFDSIDFSDYYSVDTDGVFASKRVVPKADLSKLFFGVVSLSAARRAMIDLNAGTDYRLWLRGKAALEYAVAFFAQMKRQLTKRGTPGRCVVRVHFNEDFAISLLCGHVEIPATLGCFLSAWRMRIEGSGTVPV